MVSLKGVGVSDNVFYPKLLDVDYKAIVVFVVVLDTKSCEEAARILGCSASSISLYLKRLRFITRRQLFYREGRDLEATDYAVKLGAVLKTLLGLLQDALVDIESN